MATMAKMIHHGLVGPAEFQSHRPADLANSSQNKIEPSHLPSFVCDRAIVDEGFVSCSD
jgi:hypothetical protein